MSEPSTKPYLIRAIFDWCADAGYTPYLAVQVDEYTQVPMAFVKDGKIVLNVSFSATQLLKLGNDAVSFEARFGGVDVDGDMRDEYEEGVKTVRRWDRA